MVSREYDPDGLKPMDSISEQDPRNSITVSISSGQPMSFEEYYEGVSAFKLAPNVPTEIQVQFDLARNLFVYSWFVYRFSSSAQSQAYSAMERAIKFKLVSENIPFTKRATLAPLLQKIVKLGWIKDVDFPHIFETSALFSTELAGEERRVFDRDGNEFVKNLADILPNLRNNYAHGEGTLIGPVSGLMALDATTNVINALFRDDGTNVSISSSC